ncbi:NAD-dependent epimerase/dehydratase family protein [Paenibacillus gansuensis]|uniref:NAD-dependent epimerase/dehydratase family protein n=1 Tax=Paenibacillus gansuensis TaxID=306542 RepID=A0ABW5PJQ2_9BACL
MAQRILVLGGTRFFGRRLVHRLLEQGASVTVATRGNLADDFGDRVQRLLIDREQPSQLAEAALGHNWDVIYDNICYSPQAAEKACELFDGKVKRYIFTSTLSVYPYGGRDMKEDEFDPYGYDAGGHGEAGLSYAEGKRAAEAVLFSKAPFPVVAVRFPIVLGTDDYTLRMQFHMDRIRQGIAIGIPNPEAKMGFISAAEAADFLVWLKESDVTGPVNACSSGTLSIRDIISMMESEIGKPALIEKETAVENQSPFGVPDDWYMSAAKAEQAGYRFRQLRDWFMPLIKELNHS